MILGFGSKPARDDPPSLSVIVPWRDRPEIERALAHNATRLPPGTETVIVNCGGDARMLRRAVDASGAPGVRRLDLAGAQFVKGLALNLGVHAARAARCFTLDADVLIDDDFVGAAIARLGEGCVVTVDRVVEETPDILDGEPNLVELAMAMRFVDRAGASAVIDVNRARFDELSRSAPGLALFERDDFVAVGGMNAELTGWGWEDLDLIVRLQLARGLAHHRMGRVVHMTHGDDKRAIPPGGSREASEQANFQRCIANYQTGRYLGTYEADVERWGRAVREDA